MSSALEQMALRTLIASTDVGIAACDRHGRLTMLSPGLERVLGRFTAYAEDELADAFDLYDAEGTRRLRTEEIPLVRARLGETVREQVICARSRTGDLVHLRCDAAPVHDDDGALCGAIVLAQDVSAERAAVRQQGELRDRLTTTINHRFRTPLTTLVGHAELLHERAEDLPDDARRHVGAMALAGEQVTDLLRAVTELLDLEGNAQLSTGACDVGLLVHEVVTANRVRAARRPVALVLTAPEHLVGVVDADRLRRAVQALVSNALTYAPPYTPVGVDVSADEEWLRIVVSDRGAGIPEGDRDRLVQPFERGEHPDQPVGGRGMGLAVATTVATAHGGTLTLGSHAPHGLRATLSVPRTVGSATPA